MTMNSFGRNIGARLAVLVLLTSTACATPSTAPFENFSTSIATVREGANEALKNNEEGARQYLIATAVSAAEAGDAGAINDLRVNVESDNPLSLERERVPPFLASRSFREGLYALNGALVDYAGLLSQLAAPELVNPEEFETLAKELNQNTLDALEAIGASDVGADEVALFSTTASAIANALVERQRKKRLLDHLEEAQPKVVKVVEHARKAVKLAAIELGENYREEAQPAARIVATGGNATTRAKAAADLVSAGERFVGRLETLQALDRAYAKLPDAHTDLKKGVNYPKASLESIRVLYQEGRRLQRLHKEILAASESK